MPQEHGLPISSMDTPPREGRWAQQTSPPPSSQQQRWPANGEYASGQYASGGDEEQTAIDPQRAVAKAAAQLQELQHASHSLRRLANRSRDGSQVCICIEYYYIRKVFHTRLANRSRDGSQVACAYYHIRKVHARNRPARVIARRWHVCVLHITILGTRCTLEID